MDSRFRYATKTDVSVPVEATIQSNNVAIFDYSDNPPQFWGGVVHFGKSVTKDAYHLYIRLARFGDAQNAGQAIVGFCGQPEVARLLNWF